MPDLDRDRILEGWRPQRIGRHLIVLRETASTNDVAHRAAMGGEPEGMVVFAESQTEGRGQFQRRWDSARGLGLWFSVLLRPAWPVRDLPEMTPLVAVALANALSDFAGIEVRIKRPNDLLVHGRKITGILSEARSGSDVFVIVGVGVNVNHAVPDFPLELQTSATSLAIEAGGILDRDAVAKAILQALDAAYDPACVPGEETTAAYESLSRPRNCGSFAP